MPISVKIRPGNRQKDHSREIAKDVILLPTEKSPCRSIEESNSRLGWRSKPNPNTRRSYTFLSGKCVG